VLLHCPFDVDYQKFYCRLREERGEAERALALDHKVRDLSSHNGKSNSTFSTNFSVSKHGEFCMNISTSRYEISGFVSKGSQVYVLLFRIINCQTAHEFCLIFSKVRQVLYT
jgi:hypothetical protein